MTDITITAADDSKIVVEVEGNTEAGVKFVDGWFVRGMSIADSGRIRIPRDNVPKFMAEAAHYRLTVVWEV